MTLGVFGAPAIAPPTPSTSPSAISTSPISLSFCDGSMSLPPLSRNGLIRVPLVRDRSTLRRFGELGLSAGEQIEHRHADRDAVGHLIEDHAVRSVGHVGVDLDAAIHRAGVEDENVALRAIESLARDAEDAVVLAQRRDVAGGHALELQTEDVERVGPLDRLLDAIEDCDAHLVDRVRQQRARAAHRDFGAHLRETPDVRPRDARVQHVAADADAPALRARRTDRAA